MSSKAKKGSSKRKGTTGSVGSNSLEDLATENPFNALATISEDSPSNTAAPAAIVTPPSANDLLASTGSSVVASSVGATLNSTSAAPRSWASVAARAPSPANALNPTDLLASIRSSTAELPSPAIETKYPVSSPYDPPVASASIPVVSSSTGRVSPSSTASLLGSTRSMTATSASAPALGRGGRGGGGGAPVIRNYLFTNFGRAHLPLTDREESPALLVNYADARGIPRFRGLIRNMMAPDESRVLSVIASLDPATNGVRTKPVAERGVMQGDTVYRNFMVNQDLVMSNTAVGSAHSEVIGVSMVTQGEQVEGDPINFAVAFAGSTSLIFRGFKETDESPYTAEPGHRFGLDFSAAAEETGRVDGLKRCVNVHRRARGVAGFCSSYFTALSPGVPGHKIHSIIDF